MAKTNLAILCLYVPDYFNFIYFKYLFDNIYSTRYIACIVSIERLSNMKMFTLRKISEELHLAWKIAAAKQGISMEDLAIKILESGLLESEGNEDKKGTKRRK